MKLAYVKSHLSSSAFTFAYESYNKRALDLSQFHVQSNVAGGLKWAIDINEDFHRGGNSFVQTLLSVNQIWIMYYLWRGPVHGVGVLRWTNFLTN